jgi:hypothetical protein
MAFFVQWKLTTLWGKYKGGNVFAVKTLTYNWNFLPTDSNSLSLLSMVKAETAIQCLIQLLKCTICERYHVFIGCSYREGDLRVIRPMVYVREKELRQFAEKVNCLSFVTRKLGSIETKFVEVRAIFTFAVQLAYWRYSAGEGSCSDASWERLVIMIAVDECDTFGFLISGETSSYSRKLSRVLRSS